MRLLSIGFGSYVSPERIIAHAEEINVLTRIKHPLGDVLSVSGDTAVLLSYFRNMAKLREDNGVLQAGSYEEMAHDHEQIYAYVRELDDVKVLVMANFTNEEAPLGDLANQVSDTTEVIISSYDDERVAASNLRPHEPRIFEL